MAMQFDEVFSVNISTSALFKQELNTDFIKTEILKFFDKKLTGSVPPAGVVIIAEKRQVCSFSSKSFRSFPSRPRNTQPCNQLIEHFWIAK